MRRRKVWWRDGLSGRVCEEIEHWLSVLLTVAAALLLYTALKAQVARGDELPTTSSPRHPPATIESAMAAAAPSTAGHEGMVSLALAPGMPRRAAGTRRRRDRHARRLT
jgi:hypothetical protein